MSYALRAGRRIADIATDGVSNVLDYGATGDGVTDDSTAIQAAFTVAGLAGGEVHYPPGTYRQVGISIPSNVTAVLWPGTTIVQAANTDNVFEAEGSLGSAVNLTTNAAAGATSSATAAISRAIAIRFIRVIRDVILFLSFL